MCRALVGDDEGAMQAATSAVMLSAVGGGNDELLRQPVTLLFVATPEALDVAGHCLHLFVFFLS